VKMVHCRPRCAATTSKNEPCRMTVASYDRKLGRYHDPELAPATHARNRAAKQYSAPSAVRATLRRQPSEGITRLRST
jgi:hypothetical protein